MAPHLPGAAAGTRDVTPGRRRRRRRALVHQVGDQLVEPQRQGTSAMPRARGTDPRHRSTTARSGSARRRTAQTAEVQQAPCGAHGDAVCPVTGLLTCETRAAEAGFTPGTRCNADLPRDVTGLTETVISSRSDTVMAAVPIAPASMAPDHGGDCGAGHRGSSDSGDEGEPLSRGSLAGVWADRCSTSELSSEAAGSRIRTTHPGPELRMLMSPQ